MELTSAGLRIGDIARIALSREMLSVTTEVSERVASGAAVAERLSAQRPVYGRSTGVGGNRSVPVQDPDGQLARVLRSHATSLGTPRDATRVRAMIAVRIGQLAAGGSGLSRTAFDALLELLNTDTLPPVLERGSIGTGDLSALATVGVALLDHPDGPRVQPGDALALISSNAAAIGDAALAIHRLETLTRAAVPIASLTLRAVHGNVEPFGPAVERATPFRGAHRVCAGMRQVLDDDGYADPPARIQDPFGLRAMPQGHGVLLDALDRAAGTVHAMANAPSENPVFDEHSGITHHGAFHAAYLANAVEGLLGALVQAAQLGLGRTTMLASPGLTGASAFLADGTPGASGTMLVELVAASAMAALRSLAAPASAGTVTLSRGLEDDASFASVSARGALDAEQAYRDLLAAELLTAARALTLTGRMPRWSQLAPLQAGLARLEDRDLTADLQAARQVVPDLAHRLRVR
ncbi:aromatic amino acid ammonia-lyase [Allobranchiibius sp. GilTou38]|uniref:aromatic amino acid lyase n=1 Tax=Allobranchiibius sp. GilTou38 TaxID=2815210 RepID=UPI001AA0FCBB|nr:aromatic amino acid lyase [Allobranchiibius sp. GilTou38]